MIRKFLALVVLSMLSTVLHAAPYPFSDDLESGLGAWSAGGLWAISGLSSVSPTQCVADSPAGYYTNETDASLAIGSDLNLSAAVQPALSFWHRYELEEGWDFASVEVSTNSGATWVALSGDCTGTRAAWAREQFDLTSAAGMSGVRVRFRIRTDSSVVMDGWFVDDIRIGEKPAAPTLYSPSSISANAMTLSWTPSADPAFASYRLYRVIGTNLDWHTARLVTEITSAATTNFTDNTLCPKTRYAYRLMVLLTNGIHNLGGEVTAQTVAGMDFPFLDNGEAGGGIWVAEPPWGLSSESSASPTNAWADSPGAMYSNNLSSCALTLASPVNLAGVATPVLVFKHRYAFQVNDYGNVEFSTNAGSDWAVLTNYSGRTVDEWKTVRVHLGACTNSSQTLVRFRITTDASGVTNGWLLDDISLSAAPAMIAAPVLSEIGPHSIRLTWTAAAETAFSHYAIYRDTNSMVGLDSTLAAVVSDRSVTSFVDTALASDVTCYYRVYAVNPIGGISLDSPTAASARTIVQTLPFSDSFSSNLVAWTVTGTWGIETGFLSDSPGGASYTNNSGSEARTTVNLTGTVWPVLRFWDRYRMGVGDYGWVEVSPDGSSWSRVYGILNGAVTNWTERVVDLSPWRNQSNLRIRFYLGTDGATVDDGWQVDDVVVEDRGEVTRGPPFYDGFEGGLSNWLGGEGVWLGVSGTNAPYAGTNAGQDVVGNIPQNTAMDVQLEKALNLAGTVSPQLVFWAKWAMGSRSYWNVDVSVNQGLSWTTVKNVDGHYGTASDWQRVQVSLKDYRQPSVRVRWRAGSYDGNIPAFDWALDKVSVQEQPGPIVMTSAVPHLRTMDVGWTAVTNLNDFARWEVYRAQDADVDWNDVKVGTFGDSNVVVMVDSNLSLGVTYYYAAYAVDTDDMYTRTTNVMWGTTWQAPSLLPLSNGAESVDAWYTTGAWGLDTDSPHGGSACLSDSPGGNYGNNTNGEARIAVNLTGTVWPVLRFWDRYRMGVGDYGWVEVSPDGSSWSRVYGILNGAVTNWTERVVDLSPWRNQSNLRIRFYLGTDGATVDDGWQVDDVVVEDRGEVTRGPPFYDGFEGGLSNWLGGEGVWLGVSGTNAPYAGTNAGQDVVGNIPQNTAMDVQLEKALNLAGTVSPQLVFWAKWAMGSRSYWNVDVSVNQGLSWTTVKNVDGHYGTASDWQRVQVSLKDYRQPSVRVRWRAGSYDGNIPAFDWALDKVSVQEQPGPIVMTSAVPHLRTMDVGWTAVTNLNDFARWEVYRAQDADVDWNDVKVGTFGDSNVVVMVDSNLSLGVTYYYAAYAVDTDDMYTRTTNVMWGTTWQAPSLLPLSNGAESVDAWYTTGAWGLDTDSPHGGSACLSDSPGGNYGNNTNGEARIAVNLTGTVWPVLRFWDRYRMGVGDYGWVEVSPDGSSWSRVYGILNGAVTNWTERVVDLSPWRNQSNLRIRFYLGTDGATVDDGWQVDDVVVEDRGEVTRGPPFYDGFEGGLSNWLGGEGVWLGVSGTNAPYAGTNAGQDVVGNIPQNTAMDVQLEKALNLAGTVSPQLVFWAKWAMGSRSYWNVDVSVNQGLSWTTVKNVDGHYGTASDWQRVQVSLKDYRQPSVRVRWRAGSYDGNIPAFDWALDKVSVQEQPTPPLMITAIPDLKSVDVQWMPTALGGTFQRYELYRSSDATVDFNDLRIAQIATESVTNFIDTDLVRGSTYYYAAYVVNQDDLYTQSTNVVGATTRAVAWSNFTETGTTPGQWNLTGRWGIQTNVDSICLSDTPDGIYSNSSDSWAGTSIQLTGANWPLLRFRERYWIAQGDWALVEISVDGSSWIRIGGSAMGVQSNWTERVIDLSEWKNRENLRLRFRLATDGTGVEDGWQIDDISITNHSGQFGVPLFEDLEEGFGRWLEGPMTWMVSSSNLPPVWGTNAAADNVYQVVPDGRYVMELAGSLDLSATVSPLLTFWARWEMGSRSWLGAQLSKDGGLTWGNAWSVDGYYGTASSWTQIQVSVSGYRDPNVRFRFVVSGYNGYAPTVNFGFDHFGIGDHKPGMPTAIAPTNFGQSGLLRPLLVVSNSVDAQGDPLTYRFEVFDSADLTNLVAQVPIVAGGFKTTSWEVNPDLVDQRQYWWRSKATDGTYTGDWSVVSSFYVNQTFNPPAAVVIAGPPPGSIVGRTSFLTWFPSSDVDAGDSVYRYQVQIDDTNTFASPEVSDATIPSPGTVTDASWVISRELGELSGNENLVTNKVYFWRVRAEDTRSEYSEWSSGVWWFIFGTPPPDVEQFFLNSSALTFSWGRTDRPVYIYSATNLRQQVWDMIQGPVYGTNTMISVGTNEPARFYRMSAE